MSRQVWKFGPILIANHRSDWTEVRMPLDAWRTLNEHFDIQEDANGLCEFFLWTEIESTNAFTSRRFMVVPTGVPVPEDGIYRGTVVHSRSGTVWHLYERNRI